MEELRGVFYENIQQPNKMQHIYILQMKTMTTAGCCGWS